MLYFVYICIFWYVTLHNSSFTNIYIFCIHFAYIYTSNNKYDKRKIKNMLYVHLYCLCIKKYTYKNIRIYIKIHSFLIIIITIILNKAELLLFFMIIFNYHYYNNILLFFIIIFNYGPNIYKLFLYFQMKLNQIMVFCSRNNLRRIRKFDHHLRN